MWKIRPHTPHSRSLRGITSLTREDVGEEMRLPRWLRYGLYGVVIVTTILGVVTDNVHIFLIGYSTAALLNILWLVRAYLEKRKETS